MGTVKMDIKLIHPVSLEIVADVARMMFNRDVVNTLLTSYNYCQIGKVDACHSITDDDDLLIKYQSWLNEMRYVMREYSVRHKLYAGGRSI